MKSTTSILAQIMALDPSTAVFTDIDSSAETDEVLGVLSDDLKRLWVFLKSTKKETGDASAPLIEELKKLVDEHEKAHKSESHSEEDCQGFHKKARPLKDEIDKIMFPYKKAHKLFWTAVELEFGLREELNLSIREGGVLVKIPPAEDGFASLLKHLGINLVEIPA